MTNRFVPLPPVALRVGVTGTRATTAAEAALLEALRPKVKQVLTFVRDCVAQHGATAQRLDVAAKSPDGPVRPMLRCLSPLAEGADRLVAEEAVRLGYLLHAPLPFEQADYESDFGTNGAHPNSLAAFRALLHNAAEPPPSRVLELDGGRGADQTRSYEAVGRLVVQNCDLLIAIWDGAATNKRGGTGEIMRYAARSGPPIWWIHTDPAEPERLVNHPLLLRRPELAQAGEEARATLARYLAQTILPPPHHGPHRHGVVGRCVHLGCQWLRPDRSPLDDYLGEVRDPARLPGWRAALAPLWRAHGLFIDWAGGPAGVAEPMPEPLGAVETFWEAHHRDASKLSRAYGNRYRSSYVLVFGLGGLAVAAAVIGLAARWAEGAAVAVELLALLGITALVVLNQAGSWHERWITYRLLAELCRKQRILAPLGRALPGGEISALAGDAAHHGAAGPPREAWVGWYFAAIRRGAPLPAGRLAGRALHRAAHVGRGLLVEQIAYHTNRERRDLAASRRLAHWGEAFFVLTLLTVLVRIRLLLHMGEATGFDWLGLACALLPAASAVLVGIRAYAEFELLAEESARMLRVMKTAEANICDMNFDHPLASQDLGAELAAVTMAMLQDVKGWAQLFRVKAVETS